MTLTSPIASGVACDEIHSCQITSMNIKRHTLISILIEPRMSDTDITDTNGVACDEIHSYQIINTNIRLTQISIFGRAADESH